MLKPHQDGIANVSNWDSVLADTQMTWNREQEKGDRDIPI